MSDIYTKFNLLSRTRSDYALLRVAMALRNECSSPLNHRRLVANTIPQLWVPRPQLKHPDSTDMNFVGVRDVTHRYHLSVDECAGQQDTSEYNTPR